MNVHGQTKKVKRLIGNGRPEGWHVPGIAAVASVLTVAALLSVLPGTLTGWSITGNAAPLVEAGGTFQPVVGFLQFGVVRIYIPLLSMLLVVGGKLAAAYLRRWGMIVAATAGVGAGVQPVVLSGCGCGFGTAGTTMTLLEQAIETGVL
jgi:hypothetical protein